MLRSDLCGCSDAYMVVKGAIDFSAAAAANENNKVEKDVAFKNNNPFRSCISNVNCTLIENAEDLDIFMRMYNLLEYSHNYSMTLWSLWNYYRDKTDDVYDNAPDGKSFAYKIKIVGSTPEKPRNEGDENRPPIPILNFEVNIPLKYLIILEISWFAIDKLWNRTWFIIEKRLCIEQNSTNSIKLSVLVASFLC